MGFLNSLFTDAFVSLKYKSLCTDAYRKITKLIKYIRFAFSNKFANNVPRCHHNRQKSFMCLYVSIVSSLLIDNNINNKEKLNTLSKVFCSVHCR